MMRPGCVDRLLAFLLVGLAAACASVSPAERTLETENEMLATQVADMRATATIAADRLRITIEYGQTAVGQARRQNEMLAATVAALGGDVGSVRPGAALPTPSLAALDVAAAPAPGGTPPAALAQPPLTPTTPPPPSLYNLVTAEGVGPNDCALAAVSQFSTAAQRIYVVATAANIAPGTRLASRWFRDGAEVIRHEFRPDFAIQQACVWFFIDPTETPFTPGSWSVQLEIENTPAGAPVTFTIVE